MIVIVPLVDNKGGSDGGANTCESLETEIRAKIAEANYCGQDSDCMVFDIYTCPIGCWSLANGGYDLGKISGLIDEYESMGCGGCKSDCMDPPEDSMLACVNGKCVTEAYCEEDSDCVRKNSCCDCGLGTYVNKEHQVEPECIGPRCLCAEMPSVGKCVDNACQAQRAFEGK